MKSDSSNPRSNTVQIHILTWSGSSRNYHGLAADVGALIGIPPGEVEIYVSDNPFPHDRVTFRDVLCSELVTLFQSFIGTGDLVSFALKRRNIAGALVRLQKQLAGFVASRRVRLTIRKEFARLHNMNLAFLDVARSAGTAVVHLFLEDDAILSSTPERVEMLKNLDALSMRPYRSGDSAPLLVNLSQSFSLAQLGVSEPKTLGKVGKSSILISQTPKLNTTCAFLIDAKSLQEFAEFLTQRLTSQWTRFQAIDTTLASYLSRNRVPTLFAVPEPFIQASMHEAP